MVNNEKSQIGCECYAVVDGIQLCVQANNEIGTTRGRLANYASVEKFNFFKNRNEQHHRKIASKNDTLNSADSFSIY
jgi:hypothetical protein